MYVIRRTEDSKFVAMPGSQSSYTQHLQSARTFTTREAAEREICPENEVIVDVASLLQRPRS